MSAGLGVVVLLEAGAAAGGGVADVWSEDVVGGGVADVWLEDAVVEPVDPPPGAPPPLGGGWLV
jgi:hypothetical protein